MANKLNSSYTVMAIHGLDLGLYNILLKCITYFSTEVSPENIIPFSVYPTYIIEAYITSVNVILTVPTKYQAEYAIEALLSEARRRGSDELADIIYKTVAQT